MRAAVYIWAKVIAQLEQQLDEITVATWFDDLELVELNEQALIFYTPSDFRQEIILRSYRERVEEILREQLKLERKLVVWTDAERIAHSQEEAIKSPWSINPRFSFDNFVPGKENEVPLKAAVKVAQELASAQYNPLFYYGSPGVGKTHLLYSIANEASRLHPEAKIVYVRGEQFTNELVQAIMQGNAKGFKEKYRQADLLLIDDVHFIAGKESTQEEFFNTFNKLYEDNKQIVMTSDRTPGEMQTLQERLRSRFEGGLLAKVESPGYETRKTIIKKKAISLGMELPDDVCSYIAQTVTSNVRQIEGTVKRINAYKDLGGMSLDLASVQKMMAELRRTEQDATVTMDTVVSFVCKYYGLELRQLTGSSRRRDVSEPRQIAMYLIREEVKKSTTDIGTYFNRDHSTVCKSLEKVELALGAGDEKLQSVIDEIRRSIHADGGV